MLLLLGSVATAACEGPEFFGIDRPVDPATPDGPTFRYHLRIEPGTDPSAVPIVFLPGGPGFEVMERGRAWGQVPAEYPLVSTELRGVGCNRFPGTPPEAASHTQNHAEDVLAALSAAGIDEFVVYGHSYGTVLGTMVASLAEARGTTVRAVLLEGAVGTAMTGQDSWFSGFQHKWEEVRTPALARRIGRFGFSEEEWGEWLYASLAAGSDAGGSDPVVVVGEGPPDELRAAIRALVPTGPAPEVPAPLVWATRETLCRELIDESFTHARLTRTALVPFADDCAGIGVDRPYSPADWPIRAPITYVQGSGDPVTPLARARRDHVATHEAADRTVVTVAGAGHFTMAQLGDCTGPLFAAVEAQRPFDPASCSRPTSVEVLPATR